MSFPVNQRDFNYIYPWTTPCDQAFHQDDYDEVHSGQANENDFAQLDFDLSMLMTEPVSRDSINSPSSSSSCVGEDSFIDSISFEYTPDLPPRQIIDSSAGRFLDQEVGQGMHHNNPHFESSSMDVDESVSIMVDNSSRALDSNSELPLSTQAIDSSVQSLDNQLMQSITHDDPLIVQTFQRENIHLGSLLGNGQLLGYTLSRYKSFRILRAMQENNLLDLDFPINGTPFWLDFISATSVATNVKAERLDRNSLKILKTFLNTIITHVEKIERLPDASLTRRLVLFCLEQKKYQLISKVILETGVFKTSLDQTSINEALFNALMDKRGSAAQLTPKIEGGDSYRSAYMIMQAIDLMIANYADFLELNYLKPMCENFLHSFGFHTLCQSIKPSKIADYVLSALKAKVSFPLLLEIGTKTHSIAMSISRTTNRELEATVYNTGSGLTEYHPHIGNRPLTFLSTRAVHTEKKLPWTRIFREKKQVSSVYSRIEDLFLSKTDIELDDSIYYEASQEKGSCSFQSLMAFIHHQFLENFSGSLEERKGAYKLFKTLLMTNLFDIYKERAYPSYHTLFTSKYNIHHAELALFLDINDDYCVSLFDFLFGHEELINDPYFNKIMERYINCEKHSIHSNFYFLLKILRFITAKNMTINVPTELQKDSIAHLIDTLQALPRLYRKDTTS